MRSDEAVPLDESGTPVSAAVGEAFTDGTLELDASERAFTSYLQAEQEHGRIKTDADVESLALVLVGAAHQLLLTRGPHATDLRDRMHRTVTALITAVTPQV
ncbi:hypothetical protein ITP53_25820 [Nonomuraea sp. K274]|uniref:Uncharacterized protein n=1 Tax=Nonomuraea cypriaca TaxID=1187855 RepID=A0A931AF56_9ACTN|nr:hypothetical protein [Nonomuraea cypriaca]MBF8189089.1 hypothetical protein [Nonomuraea cypriaca]